MGDAGDLDAIPATATPQPAWPFVVAGVFFGGLVLGVIIWFSQSERVPAEPLDRAVATATEAPQAAAQAMTDGTGASASARGEVAETRPATAVTTPGAASGAPVDAGPGAAGDDGAGTGRAAGVTGDASASPMDAAPVARAHATLSSVPPGAVVVRAGRVIGKTPMTVDWEAGEVGAFELSLAGYRTAKVELKGDDAARGQRVVWLDKERAAAPAAPTAATPGASQPAAASPAKPVKRKRHKRRRHRKRKRTPRSVKDLL